MSLGDWNGFQRAGARTPPLRAPYNFVRLAEFVLPSPVEHWPHHGRPLPEGLCGELVVSVAVETPLLVAGSANNSPCKLGSQYVIPGASLRGMTRAVLEIAAYGRLNFFDEGQFALRDFQHPTWRRYGPTNASDLPHAGWLYKHGDGYRLEPVSWIPVAITDIVSSLSISVGEWHGKNVRTKHDRLDAAGIAGARDWGDGVNRILVVTGPSVEDRHGNIPKETEAAFAPPSVSTSSSGSFEIGPRTFARFDQSQHEDGADTPDDQVKALWTFWKRRLVSGQPVPVFYRGDPSAAADPGGRPASPTAFFMSLTRFLKIPFANSLRDVAARTQGDEMLDARDLDFCEALFGWAPEHPASLAAEPAPRERPWRSRVFFRHASLAEDSPAVSEEHRDVVTMKPRASFYPFYLRPARCEDVFHPVDFDNPESRVAGRKRYPVRASAVAQNGLPRAPRDENRDRQENRLRFIRSTNDRPLRFVARLRFHNLHPVELGGLVWALTFGQHGRADAGRRHLLGRLKAFGYGRIKIDIGDPPVWIERNDGSPAPTLLGCLEDFENWVAGQVSARRSTRKAFFDLPEIRELCALADKNAGGKADRAGLLRFPESHAGANPADRILKGYQEIRNATKNQRAISCDPTNGDFVFLPAYPVDCIPAPVVIRRTYRE